MTPLKLRLDPSLELSHRYISNEGSQRVLMENKKI